MSMATSRKKTPVNEPVDALAPEPIIAPEEEEVPVPTQPKPAPVAEKASEKTAGFCVYIGPTIIGVVQRGTVYRGDKPEVLALLKDAVEKYPLIASLVVPGHALPESRVKVKTPGNLLYVNYHKLMTGRK